MFHFFPYHSSMVFLLLPEIMTRHGSVNLKEVQEVQEALDLEESLIGLLENERLSDFTIKNRGI
jgi:hypothetical protein